MEWALWLVAAAALLFGLDRLALWAESRGWIYWRRRKPSPTGGGAIGELIEIFQPSRQHATRERERQQLSADLPESGAPPRGVDLDAGTLRLTRPEPPEPHEP